MSFRSYTRDRRALIGTLVLMIGVALLIVPNALDSAVRGAVRSGLEQHGLSVRAGDVQVSPLRGVALTKGLRLERTQEGSRLKLEVDQGIVQFETGEVLEDTPRLRDVDLEGVRVHVLRDGPGEPSAPQRPRSLHLSRVHASRVDLILEDRGPETADGEPFQLSLHVAEGTVEDVWLDDVVRTALLRTTLSGTAGGGTIALEQGKLRLGGVDLSAFSTYLSHAAPLRMTAGRGAVWAVLTPTADDGIDAWVYVELWDASFEAIKGAEPKLIRDLSLDALVAYLQHRGSFFAHAFRARIPGKEFNGVPAHDARAVGVGLAEAFVRSVAADRLDPRRPEPRQLHPALRDPFALAARLDARDPRQRQEVFAGALHGRVFEGLTVNVSELGKSFLGLGKPFVKGEADGGLRVKIQKLPDPGELGARRFDALIAVKAEDDDGHLVLVFEPSGD